MSKTSDEPREHTSDGGTSRRDMLRLLGASLALAGASGCSREVPDKIVPHVTAPPEWMPERPLHYATSLLSDGHAIGLVATCHDGRPTKLEGNPDHPASLGAAGRLEQAAVLGLYDPDRARVVREGVNPRAFASVVEAFAPRQRDDRGAGLHVVLEPSTSPLVASLLARLRERRPEARVHFAKPFDKREPWQAARAVFGRVVEPVVSLDRADVIVALDSDFLVEGPAALRLARDFASRRKVRGAGDPMSRLYVAEAVHSVTGASADERLRARHHEIGTLALCLLAEVLGPGSSVAAAAARAPLPEAHRAWARAAARALREHAGAGVVLVGDTQPAAVHAVAHAIHDALGSVGKTVRLIASPVIEAGEPSHGYEPLARALDAGEVDTLVVLDGNPIYAAPADLDLARRFGRARRRLHLGSHENETARVCEWFVPAAHALESWGDARAFDGTVSFTQPMLRPLYQGKSLVEVLAMLAGEVEPAGESLLRASWSQAMQGEPDRWEKHLQAGLIAGSAFAPLEVRCDREAASKLATTLAAPVPAGVTLLVRRDTRVDDGRHANNAWLQELPDPLTTLTWGNAALLGAATAKGLGVSDEDIVELSVDGRSVRVPALVVPAMADDTVVLTAGHGREGEEHVARGVGVRAFALTTSAAPAVRAGVAVRRTGDRGELALTQLEVSQHHRESARRGTLADYRREPGFARHGEGHRVSLYFLPPAGQNQWAMAIDLSLCVGCNACVVACQAENNVPVVGFDGVRKHRQMHWLRLDRYIGGPRGADDAIFQPMMCQHCEAAPCEYVCPVNATTHSDDGLNQMTYNRCVGTRFCSNNCPYKVRRFNFLDYHRDLAPSEKLAMNPSVTVRARGVMEKCSFCVQRIRAAEIRAKREQRAIRTGEVVSACQQACPTGAIVFGSLHDRAAEVASLSRNERSYDALGELGTRPRVRYLARLTNPHDEGAR